RLGGEGRRDPPGERLARRRRDRRPAHRRRIAPHTNLPERNKHPPRPLRCFAGTRTSTLAIPSGLPRSFGTSTPVLGRVLVLSVVERLVPRFLLRPVEEEVEERGYERVGRRHRVGVADGPVFLRKCDVARVLADAVLELSADLGRPERKPLGRVLDHLPHLRDLLG